VKSATTPLRTLFLFIDGIGIGSSDPEINPFAALPSRIFSKYSDRGATDIAFGGVLAVTDATLGVPGLPQSATGQTALFTGINAAALLGRHLNGHPNQELRELLARESVFVKLKSVGLSVAFANCYRPQFFEKMPRRVSVTTSACLSAGVRLNTLDDLRAGRAVYQDFTHEWLRERGEDIEWRDPHQAGATLAAIAGEYDFTLYEHFLTDLAGHTLDRERALAVAGNLERFLFGVLENIDLERTSVLLSSDHGNLEDLSTKSHTRNPVHTICWGRHAARMASRVQCITDVTPVLVEVLSPE
jgi:2,3-bisphosphoglycerate-independent phosphoglycerate mutase